MSLSPISSTRAYWVAGGAAAVGMGAVGFVPLFGGPGYEAALASGLILPTLAALAVAVDVAANRPLPSAACARGASGGALIAAIGLAVCWLHGLRVGLCDPLEGTAFLLLGPGVGTVLAGVWGALAGILVSEWLGGVRSLVWLLALAGPFGGVAVSLYRFYTSPMVFAFDPFAGFFAGTLYDTVITGLGRLGSYRVGTACTLLAVTIAASQVGRAASGRLELRVSGRAGVLLLGFFAAVGSLVHVIQGPALGHYQTEQTIRAALGHSATSVRCEVVYPSGLKRQDAHALARDCDAHIAQLEEYFDVEAPKRVTAYVFATPEHKGYLMGAAHTYIAKPWRREVYVQIAPFPHRVLRHELAHVVAGEFGRGPFKVSGPLGGLIPDPGRIEGVAVAAAPKEDELTLQQWARAMLDLELLPPLDRVFRLSFLGEPSSRAYTVAGAFVEWFRAELGIEALKAWFAGASLGDIADGRGLSALEREWRASLAKVKVSSQAMHVARARFDRPAIFARRCPHVVDRLVHEAAHELGRLDVEAASRRYERALQLDVGNVTARLGLAVCALRGGQTETAIKRYQAIADDERLGKTVQARAVEALGDVALMTGDGVTAAKRYEQVRPFVVDDDHERALDVKVLGTRKAYREPIVGYLLGDVRYGRDEAIGAALLGEWSERDAKLGIADYLLGRNYYGRSLWEQSAARLDQALLRELPLRSVRREAFRTRLIVGCVLGQTTVVRQLWKRLDRDKAIEPATRSVLEEFVERCTDKRGGKTPVESTE